MSITKQLTSLFEHYKIEHPVKYIFQNSAGVDYISVIYDLDKDNKFPDLKDGCRMLKLHRDGKTCHNVRNEDERQFIINYVNTHRQDYIGTVSGTIAKFVCAGMNKPDETGRPAIFYAKDYLQFKVASSGMFDWYYFEKAEDGTIRTWVDILLDNGVPWNAIDEKLDDINDLNVVKFLSGMVHQDYFKHYVSNDIDYNKIKQHRHKIYS
jgi:hypothetical protein